MKKLLVLLALCMVFTVVLVACEDPEQPGEETTDVTTNVTTDAPTTEPGTTEPGTETTEPSTETDPPATTDTTEPPATTEPVVPDPDPVTTHISFDECDMWIDTSADLANSANAVGNFFAPGSSNTWDKIANVEDYNVAYIRVWGWVGFFAENVGEFGYQIDDQEPVYSADFAWATGDDVVAAAQGGGAKSASRFLIMIPVRDLQGEHTIKALVKDAAGTVEEITSFTMTKAVDPAAPVFLYDAAFIGTVATVGAPDIAGSEVSADGSYITLTNGEVGDPWFTFRNVNANAQFVAVKYRTSVPGKAYNFFVASTGNDATGAGDMAAAQPYVCDGQWHVAIVDISAVEAVNEENFISFLRYDIYTDGQNQSIDIAWIGAFNSAEYVEAYFAKSMIIADTTNTFVSDVNSNEAGAKFDAADINYIMDLRPGTSGWSVVEENGEKVYFMNGIDAVTADMDGAYYFKANIKQSINNAGIGLVARGYNATMSSDESVQFKITNFYETDATVDNFCGGSGIYAYTGNGNLTVVVKYYNPDNGTRVGNKVYRIPAEGSELILADDGYSVSVILDGVTYAIIDLSGTVTYDDITTTPEGAFAAKAVVTLKTGVTETIENTLVADSVNSQVGLTCRASQFKFSSVEVGGFSAIEVPALEIVEPEPVDPNAPIAVGDANYLAGVANGGNHIASAVVSDDGAYVTITSGVGGDPNFFVLPGGSAVAGVQYVGLKYRTTVAAGGEFFIGSASITGGADELKFDYIADGEWHVLILDLTAHETVVDGLVNYLRYDFFMGGENQSIDVANIALFGSLEAANSFYGIETPAEPEGFVISGSNADGVLYVTGTVTGGRFDGSSNVADAAVFYKEDAGEGLYKLYYVVDGVNNYIVMADKAAGGSITTDAAAATVFEWNATLNTHEVADDENARAFGCQNDFTYANFSAYAVSNAENNPGKYNWGISTPVSELGAPTPEQPAVFEGNWHASVDSFMYCVNGDFSDVVEFTQAATNSANNGTTITNASGTLASITANYIYLANGWLAVDGYTLENYVCTIYAADGTLLKAINLNLREAEEGVLTHVSTGMGYAGVPNRIGQNDGEIIYLGEYAGQTVTVVYSVDAVDTDYTIDLIEIDVIVP